MKILLFLFGLMMIVTEVYTQQEAQYTQFMYNKLTLNPAYAGSSKVPCISCIHRTQWIGFDGAPSSQVLNFHLPAFGERVGIGASVSHDKVGPTNSYTGSLMYAYRMKIGEGNIALGLRGSLRSYQVKWTDIYTTQRGDDEIPDQNSNRVLPNFGVGVYYDSDKFYAGFSIPAFLRNDLSYSYLIENTDFGKEEIHMYFMTGYLFDINKKIKFKPAALIKYVDSAPFDLDLNATFIFMDKLWTGASYRLGGNANSGVGESIDLLVQYQLTRNIKAGVSYDFTLSMLNEYSSGSIEMQLEYCIKSKKYKVMNARYF